MANLECASRKTGEKKPGGTRLFLSAERELGENRFANTTTDMRQFGERKLLNFNNNKFNDRRIHDNPRSRKKGLFIYGCREDNLRAQSPREVSNCSAAVSPNG